MLYISTKRKTMNFEIVGVWFQKIHTTLESAKSTFPHDCKTSIESCEENDGGPYGSLNNATFYYVQVKAPEDTDKRFIEGIRSILDAVAS